MRVLVATDGSTDASLAVDWMAHLPLPPDREVMVVTVIPPRGDAGSSARGVPTGLTAEARRVADETASRLLRGRTSTGRVVAGDPVEQIVTAAGRWGADVVVLGARGLGAIQALLVGSVSLGVVRQAPCPALVCRGIPRAVRAVTVGVDGSAHARHALEWLARLPGASALQLRLVGVGDLGEHPVSLESTLDEAARMVSARVAAVAVAAHTGAPADRIVEDAERHGSDLVVVGARGAGAVTRLLLGSVSESVLRRAGCPVLVVRSASWRKNAS